MKSSMEHPPPTATLPPPPHVIIVTLAAQGHINPALQLAKRLVNVGFHVTFSTTVYGRRRMIKAAAAEHGGGVKGLSFAAFSDGYDDGYKAGDDRKGYLSEVRSAGMKTLKDVIQASSERGLSVRCLVYSLWLPWVAEVAREAHLPSALLWIQPATVLNAYYYCFNGYGDEINANCDDPSWRIRFPGIPLAFSRRDLPSFMLPTPDDTYGFALQAFKAQMEALDEEEEKKPKILVNTFDELEPDALKSIEKYELIGIGPLIPSAFLDGKDPSDTSFGGDLFQKSSDDYIWWLSSKPAASVVYVSFGSMLKLPKATMEEIGNGLLDSGRPFLWVITENAVSGGEKKEEEVDERLSCMEELGKAGKIVAWCSQLEVLTHPSVGCFVTHCGWNSTLESLSCGVPTVAFPHWTDQGTNAKLIEDAWRTGVRVKVDDGGGVSGDEIGECIEKVMGGSEIGRELRRNARKWKRLAGEAMEEDGSSCKNLKAFLGGIGCGY